MERGLGSILYFNDVFSFIHDRDLTDFSHLLYILQFKVATPVFEESVVSQCSTHFFTAHFIVRRRVWCDWFHFPYRLTLPEKHKTQMLFKSVLFQLYLYWFYVQNMECFYSFHKCTEMQKLKMLCCFCLSIFSRQNFFGGTEQKQGTAYIYSIFHYIFVNKINEHVSILL